MDSTFYEYMQKSEDRHGPVGDLARDMIYDQRTHPELDFNRITEKRQLLAYLDSQCACDACLEAAKVAWKAYRRWQYRLRTGK